MEGLHDIEPYPIESFESGLFGLRTKIFNTKYAMMNVYCHCNLKLPFMQDQIGKFFSKDELNVLGGDFNWNLRWMIIGGTSIKEWKLKSNKKRISEYLIKDSKFINIFINEGNLVSCLIKLKEKAWELVQSDLKMILKLKFLWKKMVMRNKI